MSDIDLWDEMNEPYFLKEDHGYGTCPECGSYLYNAGAASDGDGDLYDELFCPLCQEPRGKAHEKWIADNGKLCDSEEEMWAINGGLDDDDC